MSTPTSGVRLPASNHDLAPPVAVAPLAQSGVNYAVWLVRARAGAFVWKELRHAGGSAAALEYEHWLLGELARQSLPFALPVPVRARDGKTFRHLPDGDLGVLLPRLPGRQVARHDPGEVESFGEACGALVTTLAGVSPRHSSSWCGSGNGPPWPPSRWRRPSAAASGAPAF